VRGSISPARYPEAPSPVHQRRSPSPPMPEPHEYVHQPTSVRPAESPTSIDETPPLPNVGVGDEGLSQLDERSLNALAAREIGKQMDISPSPLSSPSLPFTGRKSVSPRPSFGADISHPNNGSGFGQIQSPSPPPPPQFTSSVATRELASSPNLPQSHQSQLPPPPPVGTSPQLKSMNSTVSDLSQSDDAYRTPPEYLRNLSTPPSPSMAPASPPPVPQMSSSLSSPSSTPTTAKKISAAAFRRPRMGGPSNNANPRGDSLRQDSLAAGFRPSPGRSPSRERADDDSGDGNPDNSTTPLNLRKKTLPGIPTNLLGGPRGPGTPRSTSSPFPNLTTNSEQPLGPGDSRPRESVPGGYDDFDYLSTYLNEDDRRQSGVYNGATNGRGPIGGGPGTSPPERVGYESGRFATRLED